MSTSPETNARLRARLEDLLDQYEWLRRDMATAQERLRAISGEASSADGCVRVRVDAQARLSGLDLDARAYRRFSPSQLAAEVMRLHRQAVNDVNSQTAEVVAPFLPSGVDPAGFANGTADVSSWTSPRPAADESFEGWRARFSGWPRPAPTDEREHGERGPR